MNESEGSDYEHDDKIFLLNYYYSGFNYKLVGNNLSNYNETLNNENVLNRWIGISNSCIALYRFNKYGFNAINDAVFAFPYPTVDVSIHDGYAIAGGTVTTYLACKIESFDNYNTHSLVTDISNVGGGPGAVLAGQMSLFTCQEDGISFLPNDSSISKINVDDIVVEEIEYCDITEVKLISDNGLDFTLLLESSPYLTLTQINHYKQIHLLSQPIY